MSFGAKEIARRSISCVSLIGNLRMTRGAHNFHWFDSIRKKITHYKEAETSFVFDVKRLSQSSESVGLAEKV